MKTFFLLVVSFFIFFKLEAQFFPKKQYKDLEILREGGVVTDWSNSFVLRKSIHDYTADTGSKKAKKGALFTYTDSRDKGASFLVNSGILYSRSKTVVSSNKVPLYTQISFSPFVQFDRNTLIDKEQFNYSAGIAYTNNWLDYEEFYSAHEEERRFNVPLNLVTSYRKDRELNIESIQTSLYFTPQMNSIDKDKKLVKTGYFKPLIKGRLAILTDTKLGLEHDYIYNNANAGFEGNFLRTYSKALLGMALVEKGEYYFTTAIDVQYRYALERPDSFVENSFALWTFSISWKPFPLNIDNRNISPSVSIMHQNGEDPSKGFANQAYWAITFDITI